jgi:RNA 3'-terminal phosphate cyclase
VGKTAANRLIQESVNSATIDSYAADQIIPLLVMCPKYSLLHIKEITSHLKTNIDLLQKFHPRKYRLDKHGDSWILEYESER